MIILSKKYRTLKEIVLTKSENIYASGFTAQNKLAVFLAVLAQIYINASIPSA